MLLQATILRPATMIGTEDRIMNTWAHYAKKYGFIPLFGDGSTKSVFQISYFTIKTKYCRHWIVRILLSLQQIFRLSSEPPALSLQNPTSICCWCCCWSCFSLERRWYQHWKNLWTRWSRNLYGAWFGMLFF